MPDFEIRYFHPDGTLAVVHLTSHETRDAAEHHAKAHQHPHDRFEIHEIKGARRS